MGTTAGLGVGHPEIDAQHRAILRLVADVKRAVESGDGAAAGSALSGLWEETVAHFATEERLMEEHAYPERNPHQTAHHLFLEDLGELRRTLSAEGLTEEVASWALRRVPEWITFHIQTNDLPLARHIARRLAARVDANDQGDAPPGKSPFRA